MPMSLSPIRKALQSQYQAAIHTLQNTIEDCPDALWTDRQYNNPYWQVAYHALYYTHLYLEQDLEDFQPWEKHREGYHKFGDHATELMPYSREELIEYCNLCREKADRAVVILDLDREDSGFYWYQMPKLEHQIVNIRHLQHHAAQLADRLRNAWGLGTKWVRGAAEI